MRPSAAVSSALLFISILSGVAVGVVLSGASNNPVLLIGPILASVVIGLLLSASVRVVAQWERMLVLRLGKFSAISEPGVRFIAPVIDTAIMVEMRVQTISIQQQQAITQDNVPVVLNGVLFFKVVSAEAAALNVQDYRAAIWRLAQATLRDVAGKLSLDELLSHQDRLESEIATNIAAQAKSWGLEVDAIKLEDIAVPEELKKMMSRQASSEREKRATIIKADGDRIAASALAEAASTMARSPGAMQLRTLQTLDGLGPTASNTVVFAIPLELVDALQAFSRSHPAPAASADVIEVR
jgi:regulator of protease activity HflC (stomatin/prohibitin superfamily)